MQPYELPKEFAGFVIARLRCPICEKEFTTAIRLENFFVKNPSGNFYHYEKDGGCGAIFGIVGSKYPYIVAEVYTRENLKKRTKFAFYIGYSHEVHYTEDLDTIGSKKV